MVTGRDTSPLKFVHGDEMTVYKLSKILSLKVINVFVIYIGISMVDNCVFVNRSAYTKKRKCFRIIGPNNI